MKKAVRLLTVLASSLLLAGCEIPDFVKEYLLDGRLEKHLHWRDKFFLSVTAEDIANQLIPILALYIAAAGSLALGGLLYNWWYKQPIAGGKHLTGWILLLAAGALVIYIPVTTMFYETILPDDLTIDKVTRAMHWLDLKNIEDVVTAVWGFGITVVLPLGISHFQFVMLLLVTIAVGWSIAGHSLKGPAYGLALIVFSGMFLLLYNIYVNWIGDWYPDWDIPFVDLFINLLYTGVVALTWVACNVVAPIVVAVLFPNEIPLTIPIGTTARGPAPATQGARQGGRTFFGIPIPAGGSPSPDRGRAGSAPVSGDGRGPEPSAAPSASASQPASSGILPRLTSPKGPPSTGPTKEEKPRKPSGDDGELPVMGRPPYGEPSPSEKQYDQIGLSREDQESSDKEERLPRIDQSVGDLTSGVRGQPPAPSHQDLRAKIGSGKLPPIGTPEADGESSTREGETPRKLLPDIRPSGGRRASARMSWLDEAVEEKKRGETLLPLDKSSLPPLRPRPQTGIGESTKQTRGKKADLQKLKDKRHLPIVTDLLPSEEEGGQSDPSKFRTLRRKYFKLFLKEIGRRFLTKL